ncbi:hypothetical protein [Niallia circulans]|uniref:Uncharacterized protein n=1 Tax=Niallia circulans TaxID=1397 RepID=A0A941JIF0_NIACI|nr:hypothetical protein [Niallia circulans]MCB5237146.1 hypothetical protein [Niallia circulans]
MSYSFLEEETIYNAMETNSSVSFYVFDHLAFGETIITGKTIFIDYNNKHFRLVKDTTEEILYLPFSMISKITK